MNSETPTSSEDFLALPLPGETLYGRCARTAHWSRRSPAEVSEWLLGHRRGPKQFDMLSGLDRLKEVHEHRGMHLRIDELALRRTTPLGFTMPFMPASYRQLLVNWLRTPTGVPRTRARTNLDRGHASLGLVLRRCPDCVRRDHDKLGFAYWRAVHQFPGMWVCPWHGRPLEWLPRPSSKKPKWEVAEQPAERFRELHVDGRLLEFLVLVANAVLWCADQARLSPPVLSILVRARLQMVGLIRRETVVSHDECVRVHARLASSLAAAGLSHYLGLAQADWTVHMLTGRETGDALKWAVLLATGMPLGYSVLPNDEEAWSSMVGESGVPARMGFCKPCSLDQDLVQSQERQPQLQLFCDRRGPRIGRAPQRLYDALETGLRLPDAARVAGLKRDEADRWLRRDPVLGEHWHRSIALERTHEATASIVRFTSRHPCAKRSETLRAEHAAVKRLERYAPELLQQLLPAVQSKYSRQRLLFPET